MNNKSVILLLLCLLCKPVSAADIKPVTGSWLNLVWQDDRNNYMNPPDSDQTDPNVWKKRVEDLHGMGADYLVIMQVANEGKAFYPSQVMPLAYPGERKSPVDAIMETASSLNMKVFLSCGWARNQDDDLRDSFVIERQRQIMKELTALYGMSAAFYGWYLPVESAFEPVLPKHAVEGVNNLAAQARALTPGKVVMISPYGICNAELDNPLFEERIAALDVDVIAYQDEVGCVREPQPLPRLKENLRKLGRIHSRIGIDFWVNVESFTWEKPATNSRKSALVPAAFGRYLSQIVAASCAGADRILSFAVCGIYDKTHPYAYENYMSWLAGDARWKLLENIFAGEVGGSGVTTTSDRYSALCDGKFGQESTKDPAWTVFPNGKMNVTIDLGEKSRISAVAAKFLNYKKDHVAFPSELSFSFSQDGQHFKHKRTIKIPQTQNDLHDCWTDLVRCEFNQDARYVKVEAISPNGTKLMCDEILINQ